MKTTQGKAVNAFATVAQIGSKSLNSLAAYKLFRLKKALSPIVEFQSEQEYKIIAELGGTVDESGKIQMDAAGMTEYIKRHKELEVMECDIDFERVEMHITDIPKISVSEMDTLDEFIDWKE